jgi:hypothetical protein
MNAACSGRRPVCFAHFSSAALLTAWFLSACFAVPTDASADSTLATKSVSASHVPITTVAATPHVDFTISTAISGSNALIKVLSHTVATNIDMQIYGTAGLKVNGGATNGPLCIKTLHRSLLANGEIWSEQAGFVLARGVGQLHIFVTSPGKTTAAQTDLAGTDKQGDHVTKLLEHKVGTR